MKKPMEEGSVGADKASSSMKTVEKGSCSTSMLRQEGARTEIVTVEMQKTVEKGSSSTPALRQEKAPIENVMEEDNKLVQEWVVVMQKKLSYTDQSVRWATHFIFRVPEWIKNMTNSNAYRPWLVSLGPYHHNEPDLMPMEEHKRRAVKAAAERMKMVWEKTKRMEMDGKDPLVELASVVDKLVVHLQEAYDDLDEKWVGNNTGRFKEMMLTDGCFLLEIIRVFRLLTKGQQCPFYASDDPVFSKRGFLSLYLALKSDVIVMENQLPLVLLKELEEKIAGCRVESKQINVKVFDFLGRTYHESLCLHPLDILHFSFCDEQQQSEDWGDWDDTMPSVTELAEAGIQFKKCNTGSVHAIDFQSGVLSMIMRDVLSMPGVLSMMRTGVLSMMRTGVLSMPEIEVNDRTEKEFLNLMAFERLYGNAGSNATAFMIFMDNLIDSENDVALLRSKGVIKNMLSSDIEAAKLFNTLSKGALLSPSSHLYGVRRKVNKHCKKPSNMWRANFKQTYMKNPWVFSAFVASILLLIATFLQTIYTVMPYYTKS